LGGESETRDIERFISLEKQRTIGPTERQRA